MDEQSWSGALSMLLIVHCNTCSWLRGKLVGDQGEKWELWGPQSHITDFAATLKAAEKRKAKKKFKCDRTQGKRHALLSKTRGSAMSQQNINGNGKYSQGNHGMLPILYTWGELSILRARDTLFKWLGECTGRTEKAGCERWISHQGRRPQGEEKKEKIMK